MSIVSPMSTGNLLKMSSILLLRNPHLLYHIFTRLSIEKPFVSIYLEKYSNKTLYERPINSNKDFLTFAIVIIK